MPQQYSEVPPTVRIAARAMADSKYNLASQPNASAATSAETEYQRLMSDYAQNGERSELATRMRAVNARR